MKIMIFIIIFLPLIAQLKVKLNYSKYSKINNSTNMTGYEIAKKILSMNGLSNIKVVKTHGELTDHYDPISKEIRLSENIYSKNSISAAAVAAHEVGHAIQHKEAYSFLEFRTKLFPIVNFTSNSAYIVILIGFILNAVGIIKIAILLLLVSLLFQLVTLPVEFNASSRAKIQLNNCGLITENDSKGINKVLSAASFTYVASFLASAMQILRLVLITRNRD